MKARSVRTIVSGHKTVDGAGVNLVRVLGPRTVKDFDPFLMLDAFDSTNPDDYIRGFPMHPHRGIETVTYLIEGEIEHQDSLGHKGVIHSGDSQWMTAGNGIMHQEMPAASPRMLGLQFWINLAAKDKMVPPKYRNITKDMITVVEENGAIVRIISGTYNNAGGAIQPDYVQARFLDVTLEPGTRWEMETLAEDTVFAYIFQGTAAFESGQPPLESKQAVLFTQGDILTVFSGMNGVRLVLVSGKPLGEPVAWGGPIVMNTEAELEKAFSELESGTFIKHG